MNPLETRFSGDPFHRDFGSGTKFRCTMANKTGSGGTSVTSLDCYGVVDNEDASRNKPVGNEEVEFDIPFSYGAGVELLMAYWIDGTECSREITYHYKWSEPELPATPVDPNNGCVTAGTLVTMADGTRTSIESVLPGSRILAYDTAAKAPCFATVEKLLVHHNGPFAVSRLLLGSGEALGITANHPIYTQTRGWQTVDALKPGEVIFTRNALTCAVEPTTVTSIIRDCSQAKVVYNLKTSQGNYFANDLLVHNKCLSAGSLIDTLGGPRAAETLRVGDVVYGRVDGRRVATAITHVYRKETVLPSLPGKRLAPGLAVTVNHRVWDNGAFRPAGDLSAPGESITGPVYDIQTSAGNYYACGLLMTAQE